MSYYKYDKETLNEINSINEKISEKQKQIFDKLLKISQSFSDEKFTKKERNEIFEEVDVLKQEIKAYNEKLKEIMAKKKELVKVEKNASEVKEDKKVVEKTKKEEKKSEEFVDTVEKLENTLKESEELENIVSKRKKARTQLVVVEDDDSLSGKIKDFFGKLRRMIKK